ncbi:MAG: nuclease [Piscirickettsiaceae bacterium]|nr:MAG: nuclease [Piscirickettsiaceae bacterium]
MQVKSPIKDSPLRNPGETLDNQINELINAEAMSHIVSVLLVGILTATEWWRWYMELPPRPYVYTVIFIIVLIYTVPKIFKIKKQLKSLRQGLDGEKAVGQYLEGLREQGAKVFHDIPGDGFNLDHVIIAPSGIYVIETKTYSKPEKGRAVIIFDGTSVKLNNLPGNEKPIIQVIAAASWLKALLKESTGKQFETKPVVVFPGWFVEPTSETKNSDVWVLNPKALPSFVANSANSLSEEQISMAAFHLSRYVRGHNKANK